MELRYYPDPVLRRRCRPYAADEISEAVEAARNMLDVMYRKRGVGLAGPQAGLDRRIFVLDVSEERNSPLVLINPAVVAVEGEPVESEEGCLSFPGLYAPLARAPFVRVEFLDERGEPKAAEGEGLFARAVLHETDHLDGILFIDRLSAAERMRFRKQLRALERAFQSG